MFRTVIAMLVMTVGLWGMPAQVWARKGKPAPAPAPAEETKKDKNKDATDAADEDAPADDVETHKARAKEVGAAGKDVDKAKTKGQLDKLNAQVADLDKKVKESGKKPAEEPAASTKKKKGAAASQPTTQETVKGDKGKAKAEK